MDSPLLQFCWPHSRPKTPVPASPTPCALHSIQGFTSPVSHGSFLRPPYRESSQRCLTLVSFWNFGACVPCPVALSLLRVFEDSITWTVLTNPSTGSNWSPAPAALTASEYPEGWTWENTFLGHWFLSKKQSLSKRKESPFCGLDMKWILRMLTYRGLGPWLVVPLGKW